MLDNHQARSVVGKFIDPIAYRLVKLGVSANLVTVIGTVGISVSAVIFFSGGEFFIGTAIILLFVFSDLLDGAVARLSERPNPIGAFLDSTLDRVTDAALFGSVAIFYANQDSWLFYPALMSAFAAQFISYIKAKAESQQIKIQVGIAERPERVILLLVGTGFTGLGIEFALDYAIVVLAVITVITVLQRMVAAFQTSSK